MAAGRQVAPWRSAARRPHLLAVAVLQVEVGVEVDHDALVGLRRLDQPLAFLAGVIGLGVAGRGEVPGVYNFDRVATLICKGKQTDWRLVFFFRFPLLGKHPGSARSDERADHRGNAGGRRGLQPSSSKLLLHPYAFNAKASLLLKERGLPLPVHP